MQEQLTNLGGNPALLAGAGIALLLMGVALALLTSWLVQRSLRAGEDGVRQHLARLMEHQAQIQGALGQITQSTQSGQSALHKTLNERLDAMRKQLGDSLEQNSEKTGESLKTLAERLALIDRAQKNIEILSQEVTGLQALLSNKQARGAFGEIQMQDMVREFLPPNAYAFQETLSNHNRVDCLIRLPEPNDNIAVDSKFPLENWRAMNEAPDEAAKKAAARLFAAAVKKHVDDIARKYLPAERIARPALMFLPSEAIYMDLHTHFPDLVEKSFRAGVAIVAPTTFMATLHTMRAVMKDAQVREQAHVIQREVQVLMDDLGRLDKRVHSLDNHFSQTRRDVEQILISTRKLLSRGEKIGSLHLEEPADTGADASALVASAETITKT